MNRSAGRGHHVAALDGLRGVAVAAVVAYHLRPEWVPGGYLGVDLFFVLSGYLITSLLLDERAHSGGIDLLAFAGRRLRRLLPAVLLVVLAVVVYESARGDFGQVEQVRRHAVGTLAYVANWVFIADGDSYFADVAGPSMLRHMWSLAVEEQFYLLWPVTVLAVVRFGGRRAVGAAALALGILSVGWMVVQFDGADPSRAYFGTDTRIFEPLIGAVGAVAWPLRSEKPAGLARFGALCASGWLLAVFVVDDDWAGFYRGGAALLGVMALLTVVTATMPGRMGRVAELAPLVWLGAISYGVYLWHWPILLMLRRNGWTGVGLDGAVVVLTLGVSTMSYVLVEQPIRRVGRAEETRVRRWRPVGVAGVSVLLVGIAVLVMTRSSFPAEAVTADEVIADLPPRPAPEAEDVDERAPRPATVVLIGDSSAWTAGGGMVTSGADQGPYVSPFDADQITLVNLARKGYRLALGATTDVGVQARDTQDLDHEALWFEVVADVRPDLIVAMFGLNDLQGLDLEGAGLDPASPGAKLLRDLAQTTPVLVLSTPRLVAADMPDPDTAAFFEAASHARTDHFNDLLAELAAADVRIDFLDYGEWLCPDDADPPLRDGCRTTVDGDAVRYDGVHYSIEGAAVVAEWLTEPLLAVVDAEVGS